MGPATVHWSPRNRAGKVPWGRPPFLIIPESGWHWHFPHGGRGRKVYRTAIAGGGWTYMGPRPDGMRGAPLPRPGGWHRGISLWVHLMRPSTRVPEVPCFCGRVATAEGCPGRLRDWSITPSPGFRLHYNMHVRKLRQQQQTAMQHLWYTANTACSLFSLCSALDRIANKSS